MNIHFAHTLLLLGNAAVSRGTSRRCPMHINLMKWEWVRAGGCPPDTPLPHIHSVTCPPDRVPAPTRDPFLLYIPPPLASVPVVPHGIGAALGRICQAGDRRVPIVQ